MIVENPRKDIIEGARLAARLIRCTYGPHGRNVLIQRHAGHVVTCDGATVIREAGSANSVADMVIRAIREACVTVESLVGDGTSTTALLAASILEAAYPLVIAGICPMGLAQEIREASENVIDYITSLSVEITESQLEQVALVASRQDQEIATNVAKACLDVGEYGTVVIQDGYSTGIVVESYSGMRVVADVSSPRMVENILSIEAAFVTVFAEPIFTARQITSCLEEATQWPHNPLLIVAPYVSAEALRTILMNRETRTEDSPLKDQILVSLNLKSPPDTDRQGILWDIAALTGSTVVDQRAGMGLRNFKPEWFGTVRKAEVKTTETILTAYDEHHDTLDAHILRLQAELYESSYDYDRDQLQERIASLDGGLCVMKVAEQTPSATRERKARIEDTLCAVQSALRHGVVPGGGMACLYASERLPRGVPGYEVFRKVLQQPVRNIVHNGQPGQESIVVYRLLKDLTMWVGWDGVQGIIRDLRDYPSIVDPTAVVVEAIKAATSVACTLLQVETVIT